MPMQTDHVAHVRECTFYGVRPLTGAQIVQMHADGFESLSDAFSIASDLDVGFTWDDAIQALRTLAHA